MNELEQTYRRALRWYPKAWRAANEDAVIGTLLDVADEEQRTAPATGELNNLRIHALAGRAGLVGRAIPLGVRTRAATIALSLAFVIAAAGLVLNVWQLRWLAGASVGFTQAGSYVNPGMLYYGAWVMALIFALVGLRRVSAAFIIATLPIAIVLATVPGLRSFATPGTATVGFLELHGVVYVLGLPTASPRFRAQLAIISGSFLVLFGAIYWIHTFGYWGNGALGVDYFWAPFAVWLTLLGLPATVVASVIVWRARRSAWSPAMLLAAVPLVGLSLVAFTYLGAALIYLSEFAGIALLVGAILGLLRIFGLRIRITRV